MYQIKKADIVDVLPNKHTNKQEINFKIIHQVKIDFQTQFVLMSVKDDRERIALI